MAHGEARTWHGMAWRHSTLHGSTQPETRHAQRMHMPSAPTAGQAGGTASRSQWSPPGQTAGPQWLSCKRPSAGGWAQTERGQARWCPQRACGQPGPPAGSALAPLPPLPPERLAGGTRCCPERSRCRSARARRRRRAGSAAQCASVGSRPATIKRQLVLSSVPAAPPHQCRSRAFRSMPSLAHPPLLGCTPQSSARSPPHHCRSAAWQQRRCGTAGLPAGRPPCWMGCRGRADSRR